MTNTEQRLEEVESKLLFSEDNLQALNDALVKQQQRIDQLEQEVKLTRRLLEAFQEPDVPHDPNEPPPHY